LHNITHSVEHHESQLECLHKHLHAELKFLSVEHDARLSVEHCDVEVDESSEEGIHGDKINHFGSYFFRIIQIIHILVNKHSLAALKILP
jgi:hypothetical protein